MNLIVIATPLIEIPPSSYSGMEREAGFLAKGLRLRGHDVTLYAKTGSTAPLDCRLVEYDDEKDLSSLISEKNFDAAIDFTHEKYLSVAHPDWPVINNFQIMSLTGNGINPVFISHGQKKAKFPNTEGPIIYYGLDLDEYPFYDGARDGYLLFMGQVIREKRIEWACQVAIATNRRLKIYGPQWGPPEYTQLLRDYQEKHPDLIELNDSIGGQEKIDALSKAYALIHPVGGMGWAEAGAIVILEAMAVGTPIIGSDNGCIPEYLDVEPPVGFVCNSVQDMVGVVDLVRLVRPKDCRKRAEYFTMDRMSQAYERLAEEVANGKKWNI